MYDMHDLFEKRSVAGARLDKILKESAYTKLEFCKDAEISRPTLDKILTGTITSQTNYEKHMEKVLNCLHMTPDSLMGNVKNAYIRAKELRGTMRLSTKQISKATGISLARLSEIESGEQASMAELRDIAFCLRTSVRNLLGTNIFPVQIGELDIIVNSESGFWGHIGVLPSFETDFLWFPISGKTYEDIQRTIGQDYMVVPCMNNKVLFLNAENIQQIVLLEDACDSPCYCNWDPKVDCGEIPLVVYESLQDYMFADEEGEELNEMFSPSFQKIMQEIIEEKQWSEDDLEQLTEGIFIYFKSGKSSYTEVNFESEENISEVISEVYDMGELSGNERFLYFYDTNEMQIMLNKNQIVMLELPLLKTEEAICRNWDTLIENA